MGQNAMTCFSLREAAEQAKVSKSTIWRAIKNGKLSAPRTDDGGFSIDPAELFRAFPPQQSAQHTKGQGATPATIRETASESQETALLRTELAGAKALQALLERQLEALTNDRDAWQRQAERLVAIPAAVEPQPARQSLLRRLFG